jgi:hypothetical protein
VAAASQPRKEGRARRQLEQHPSFNVAAASQPRKGCQRAEITRSASSFNVAAASQPRKAPATVMSPSSLVSVLQCGRGFAAAERSVRAGVHRRRSNASMWPRLRSRGKVTHVVDAVGTAVASMWPRLRSRGKVQYEAILLVGRQSLQCGRGFAAAESTLDRWWQEARLMLQCGRGFAAAERWSAANTTRAAAMLQCGRGFAAAESSRWSPNRFVRTLRFNVAAASQPRKVTGPRSGVAEYTSFNVAAASQPRKA